jgi:hypothetical protein
MRAVSNLTEKAEKFPTLQSGSCIFEHGGDWSAISLFFCAMDILVTGYFRRVLQEFICLKRWW